jgi:hypothetical protein
MCFHRTLKCKKVPKKSTKFIIDEWMDEKQCQRDVIIIVEN